MTPGIRASTEQPLRALIIDDSPTDRLTLSNLVTKKIGCTVETADNGLEGLDKISRQRFDVVFLDLNMPILSGQEVLQEIRANPSTTDLPVVVISGESDRGEVCKVMQLGIYDYLVKPIKPDVAAARLSKSLGNLTAAISLSSGRQGENGGETPAPVLLVADADANFRHFFDTTLGRKFNVVGAANGAEALTLALQRQPQALFAAEDLGAFRRDSVARKIRAIKKLEEMKIFALIQDDQRAGGLDVSLYDGVVRRSFVAETFLNSLNQVFASGVTTNGESADLATQLQPVLSSGVEQVFGMMMSTELTRAPEAAKLDPATPAVAATVQLAGDTEAMRLTVSMTLSRAAAVTMAARKLKLTDEEAGRDTEAVVSSVLEVMNVAGARIKNSLDEQGKSFRLGIPQVHEIPAGEIPALAPGAAAIHYNGSGDLRFSTALFAECYPAKKLPKAQLREGVILAAELSIEGAERIAKGERLSSEMIAHIKEHGPDEIMVFEAS